MSYTVRVRDNDANKEMTMTDWQSPFIPAKGDFIEVSDSYSEKGFIGFVQGISYSLTTGFTPGDGRYDDNDWSEIVVTIYIGPKQ